MRRLTILLLILLMTLLVAACGSSEDGKEAGGKSGSKEIGVTYTTPETGSTHMGMEKFKEFVEEKTEGSVSIELYPNGQLYASEREAIEATQAGNIEMTVTASAPVAGFNPHFLVLDLPFLFPTHEIAYEALDGELGQQLLDELPEQGLVGLAYGETGMRQLSNSKQPINKPEDLSGLTLRTMENEVHIDSFKEYGANASPFAFGELYSALQQNVYDGMENPLNLIDQMKFYEVQDYLTISNHAYTATVGFMNEDVFKDLTEEEQEILRESAKEAMSYQRGIARDQDDEGLEVIKENMEITELNDEEKNAFKEASESIYEKYEDEIGKDLIDLARSYSN